ncbi:MAG: hypothetical protein WBM29_09845, partial [Candidatus Deferrimicrobium sp.]
MGDDNVQNYEICLRNQKNDYSSECKAHFNKRGILVLEVGSNDHVYLLLGNKDGSVNLTLAIPNADFLQLVDRYVGALQSGDDELADDGTT